MLDKAVEALIGYGALGIVACVAIIAAMRIYLDAREERARNREAEAALADRMVAKAETYALKAMENNAALRQLVEKLEEKLEREKMERERAERQLAAYNRGGRDG